MNSFCSKINENNNNENNNNDKNNNNENNNDNIVGDDNDDDDYHNIVILNAHLALQQTLMAASVLPATDAKKTRKQMYTHIEANGINY